MELYQLKTFVTVAEQGHLTRAADRLHTSQPAVSAHIKALEEELGVALFERTARGMKLTHAGLALKARAQGVIDAVDAVHFEASRLKDELSGNLRIGLNVDPRYLKVTELLTVMRNRYPAVEMRFQQRMTWEVPADLLADHLDAAFVYRVPEGGDICALPIDDFELVVVGPMAWRDKLETADWPQVLSMPWVWTHPEAPYHSVAETLFQQHGIRPHKAVVADQDATIRNFVATGVGLSLMIADEARESADREALFVYGQPVATIALSLIYLCRRGPDPLIQAICECVARVWRRSGRRGAGGNVGRNDKRPA